MEGTNVLSDDDKRPALLILHHRRCIVMLARSGWLGE